MAQSRIEGDLFVNGAIACTGFSPPASSITNAAVEAAAGIVATKLEHQDHSVYAQANGTNNTAKRQVVKIVYGATGDIIAVKARNTTTATAPDSTTVDVYKNGTTVLSAVITLNAAAGTTVLSGTLSVSTLVAGDVLEVVTALSGTNVGQGVAVDVITREDAN